MTNKILIIALEFPPIRASNDRTYHFCRYLPQSGWYPVVVSPRTPGKWMISDYSLPIPPEVEVHDAPAYQNNWVARLRDLLKLLPDTNLFMVTSYRTGGGLLRKSSNEIRLIYATTPSGSAIFSSYLLAKKYRKPLILDFRDPYYPPLVYRSLFRSALKSARRIITTTEAYKEVLVKQGADPRAISIIENGTNQEAIDQMRSSGISRSTQFTVIYAGVLIPLYRVLSLLKAVNALKLPNLRVVIVGRVSDDTQGLPEYTRSNNLANVEFKGRLSQEDTIKELLQATVAYNGSAHPGGIGGKVYDYLACGLPMLGYNPADSATARFIREQKVGLTADTEQVLIDNLRFLYDNPDTVGALAQHGLSVADRFDRKKLAKRLADILDDVMHERSF